MSAYTHTVTYLELDSRETVVLQLSVPPVGIREGFDMDRGVVIIVRDLSPIGAE